MDALLSHGADSDILDEDWDTPLLSCCQKPEHSGIVESLLKAGTNVHIINKVLRLIINDGYVLMMCHICNGHTISETNSLSLLCIQFNIPRKLFFTLLEQGIFPL